MKTLTSVWQKRSRRMRGMPLHFFKLPRIVTAAAVATVASAGQLSPPENPGASALDYLPSLVIRFSDVPRTNKGLVFGSNPNCDVVLKIQGVSNIHFSLTFDEHGRPIINDLNSLMGTQVTYDGEGKGARRDFRWIVGGHEIPQAMTSIILTVINAVSVKIVVQPHDITSPEYMAKVACFRQGSATTESLLDDLGFSNPPTRPRTGAHTPSNEAIHLQKKLGAGAFGVVTRFWNVSTGEEHVVKTPSPEAIRDRRVDHRAWKQEAYIMGLVSHDHIVKLINSFWDPHPQLHLEYMPFGSLDQHNDISYKETFSIVHQCLSALVYLHEQEMPIAHRDIKPPNILIESRSDKSIFVKLGDFGLSRDGFKLSTFCGTRTYLAPEIYLDEQRRGRNKLGYTIAVDIWSLGVVACELLYDLPEYKSKHNGDGVAWCKKIAKEFQRNIQIQPTALELVLQRMVVVPPEYRHSARECFNALGNRLSTDQGSSHKLTPHGEEDQTTVKYAPQNGQDDNLSTVVWQPAAGQQNREPENPWSGTRRYSDWQQGPELQQGDSFYVGCSLAAEEGNSEHGANPGAAGMQAGRISGAARSSIPRAERGESYLPSGTRTVEGSHVIDADGHGEMAAAAVLLASMSPKRRAP
ncbi:protein kinase, partial [Metarhizium majus ARSEF 297]